MWTDDAPNATESSTDRSSAVATPTRRRHGPSGVHEPDPVAAGVRQAQRRTLVGLLGCLAGVLAANSLLGPLAFEVIEYHYSESLINQGIGLDAVALFVAVPVALVAAVLVRRGHRAGPVLALVPATFAAYMAPQYAIGPDYLGLPGNNERFFAFHLALFVLGVGTAIVAWQTIDRSGLEPRDPSSDRRRAWVLIGLIVFVFVGRWLAGLVELVQGDPSSVDYRENPTAYLLIGFLDLGVVVPAAVVAAVGLRLHRDWARVLAYTVIGWFSLVPAAVAAMAVVMQVEGDPNASSGATALFCVAATVFTVGAAGLYRPMFRHESAATDGSGVER